MRSTNNRITTLYYYRAVKISRLIVPTLLFSIVLTAMPPADLNSLSWLAGSWQMKRGETVIEEHWTTPAAGTMIGMGRTIAKDRSVAFEYLRIIDRDGTLVYIAQPNGKAATEFKAINVAPNEIVFANPAHDFPKRITYTRLPDGNVRARVEGDDPQQAEEFLYTRMR